MSIKIPNEIYREIYKYLYDITELNKLNKKYYYKEYNNYRYYFEKRYIINNIYYFTRHYIIFPNIVSAYLFDNYKCDEDDYYIYDDIL